MRRVLILSFLIALTISIVAGKTNTYHIPLNGNTYVYPNVKKLNRQHIMIDKEKGLQLWQDTLVNATTHIYLHSEQHPNASIVASGKGAVEVTFCGKNKVVHIDSKLPKEYDLGTFATNTDGYVHFAFRILSQKDSVNVEQIVISNADKSPIYLKSDFNTYFGLRGPSCHLNYDNSVNGDADWAMISVMVPQEYDQMGSYYMALGFNGGYFGFQNNNKDRRQVLFSVWNTQESDNPQTVMKQHQTTVVNCGSGVTAQNFGGEGSGKQSFINVDWQAGKEYTFLLHATKADSSSTDYSAWFYDSVKNKWLYIATLRRPNTSILLRGLHSFIENFDPLQGDKIRKAYYFNGWARLTSGEWVQLNKARITNDNTGNNGKRLDFYGAMDNGRFYLMNGGYFDRPENFDRNLTVCNAVMSAPNIDLSKFKY